MAWLWKSKKTLPPLKFSADLVHESEAFRQAYHSILAFCGHTPPPTPPSRLLLSRDIERYGILNFAFESAYAYFSDESFADEKISSEIIDIVLATTDAQIQFLRNYTLFDSRSVPDHRFPSKGLLLVAVYLHNLWVIKERQPEAQRGLSPREVDDWIIPMQDFCTALEKPEFVLNLEDNLTAQQFLLHFLGICVEHRPVPLSFATSIQLLSELRKEQPTIAILLEQLLKYLPLSYFWFLGQAPYHLPPLTKSWSRRLRILFTRRALPLVMTLADNLVLSIFKSQKLAVAQNHAITYTTFNAAALEQVRRIFTQFEAETGFNKYFTTFRLLFYFYMVQSKHLHGLEQAIIYATEIKEEIAKGEQVWSAEAVVAMTQFMEETALVTSVLPIAIANKRDRPFQSIERMVNNLTEHGFSRRCQRIANRFYTVREEKNKK